ncbi:MAG: hypothetical protein RL447_165 [Bacteroidota bacterium]|jgi:hypothetical protein
MKFINYLEKVSGISIYGLSSLLLFFLFFSVMLIWVWRTSSKQYKEISQIPLQNEP